MPRVRSIAGRVAPAIMGILWLGGAAVAGTEGRNDPESASGVSRGSAIREQASVSSVPTAASWQFEPNVNLASAGGAASTVGDVNGDGISDFAVGATGAGRVYVFFGAAGGPAPAPSQTITSALTSFGAVVAPAGDVNGDGYFDLLTTAPYAADGRVFVYYGSAGGLQTATPWTYTHADAGFANAMCGASAASAGDVNNDGYDDIVVGIPFSADGAGAAYVFMGGAGGLATGPGWAQSGGAGWSYGASVAGAGDVNADGCADVIVGAPGVDMLWLGNQVYGGAFVYHGGPSGLATLIATRLFGAQFGAFQGAAVSGAGDINADGYADVAVGAPLFDAFGATDAGRAMIFPGSPLGVSDTLIWQEYGIAADAQFGAALAPAGDVNGDGLADLAVGVPSRVNGSPNNGYAVIVRGVRAGGGGGYIDWFVQRWTGSGFGAAVGTAGDVNNDGFGDLVVGSPLYDNTEVDEGLVEIFYGAGDAPVTVAGQAINGGETSPYYGWVATGIGDMNGDGFGDVAVSAPTGDLGGADYGAVYLYGGGPGGLSFALAWSGEQAGSNFGFSVARAGDVNGDGYDDIVVGAPTTGASGKAYLWYGGPLGPGTGAADWTAEFGTAGAQFGVSVAGAGDVNGDGYADVIVGANNDDNGQTDEGRAYVFLGSPAGLSAAAHRIYEADQDASHLGNSVAGAGDVNRDGFSDVIVGVEAWDVPLSPPLSLADAGRALVFHGSASGLPTAPSGSLDGGLSLSMYGHVVAPAGDIDGDGYSDVIVTAHLASLSFTQEGAVYVHRGGPAGLSASPHWWRAGGQNYADFAASAGTAGDVNGDGLSDVIVGGVFSDRNGRTDCGEALIFAGPLTGASGTTPVFSYAGTQNWENVGHVVATAGDINGDGYSDVVTGAPGFDDAFYNEGHTLVFWGNGLYAPGDGAMWQPRQRRGDDAAPIALLGRPGTSPHAFRLAAWGLSAAGVPDRRLEWETEPVGTPFDGLNLGRSAWDGSTDYWTALQSGPIPVPAGNAGRWRARVASRSPYFPHSPWFSPQGNGREETDFLARAPLATGVDGPPPTAASLAVSVAPNPFNPRTVVAFDLPRDTRVRVELFDARGRSLGVVLDEERPAGRVEAAWDGRDAAGRPAASGTYYAQVKAAGATGVGRLVLVR